jgi:hypothetical protein
MRNIRKKYDPMIQPMIRKKQQAKPWDRGDLDVLGLLHEIDSTLLNALDAEQKLNLMVNGTMMLRSIRQAIGDTEHPELDKLRTVQCRDRFRLFAGRFGLLRQALKRAYREAPNEADAFRVGNKVEADVLRKGSLTGAKERRVPVGARERRVPVGARERRVPVGARERRAPSSSGGSGGQ